MITATAAGKETFTSTGREHPVLQPIQLGSVQLKNRAVVAPMSRVSTRGDGVPTENMQRYYAEFGSGGFGLIITEGTYTDNEFSQGYENQPGIVTARQAEAWSEIVSSVHQTGAKIFLQLMHAGALSQFLRTPRAPSAVKPLGRMLTGYGGQGEFPVPLEMTRSEIEKAIAGFASSAQQAIKAGFDGIEVHAANGYLLHQFITEYTNLRQDCYGGKLQDRIRFVSEVLGAIRASVGEHLVVGVRLSQGKVNDFDYHWPGGLTDGRVIFGAVRRAGADYIHFASEGKGFDHGCLTLQSESLPQFARNETHLPVIGNGGLESPAAARRILEEGHGDLVALGTGALANPDWPLRIADGLPLSAFDVSMLTPDATIESSWAWAESWK